MEKSNYSLKGKIAVITGGGGVLCGVLAHALAREGAKVAILDLNLENAIEVAAAIKNQGGEAIGVKANVLQKTSLVEAHQIVLDKLGPCDILVNGAGGNHPMGTTAKPFLEAGDLENEDLKTFFDLDTEGIKFVFDLNFIGSLFTNSDICEGYGREKWMLNHQYFLDERFYSSH